MLMVLWNARTAVGGALDAYTLLMRRYGFDPCYVKGAFECAHRA